MRLDRPFRGSAAVAAGLLTRDELRGPRFRRLFPDVHAPAHLAPDGCGVLAGYAAAELLRASCGPRDAPAEVCVVRPT